MVRSVRLRAPSKEAHYGEEGNSRPHREIRHAFRINDGKGFRLDDFDPGDTCGLKLDKGEAAELLQLSVGWLAEEQAMLYAQERWSLLLIFQAMDAAGKDSTIKHVMSGVNPQGCQVYSFKQPSSEDLQHDFLWRYVKAPSRTRADRNFQSLLLRGGSGRARARGDPGNGRICRRRSPASASGTSDLPISRILRIPHPTRDDHPQILSARFA